MEEITPEGLFKLRGQQPDLWIIDVREEEEFEDFNIGGQLIPLSEFSLKMNEIPANRPIVFVCKRGIRSSIAIQRLQQYASFPLLINLKGGLEAWKKNYPPEPK